MQKGAVKDESNTGDGTIPVNIADLGFFAIERLCSIARCKNDGSKKSGKRYFVSRLQPHTNLYNRRGHLLKLKGILPQQVGQVREMGAVLGQKNGVPVRLILLRVPKEVAEERQTRIIEKAKDNGNEPSKEVLELAHCTIVITNIPRKMASYEQILVLLRLRWQIERLFRLWKEGGKIDEWRTKKPCRILCEIYANPWRGEVDQLALVRQKETTSPAGTGDLGAQSAEPVMDFRDE